MRFLFLVVALSISCQLFGRDLAHDSLSFQSEKEVEYNAPNDTIAVALQKFSSEKIATLSQDPDFNYKQPPTMAESIWQRLLSWLGQFLNALFEGATGTDWGRVLVYAAALVGLVLLVLMILKVDAFRVFYAGADRGSVTTGVFHENIHEMDFDKLINDALSRQKYREGIRLIFLHALKVLTDKQFIYWEAGKTNHDYVEEVSEKDLKSGLNDLSYYFDYAWYGNFPVEESTFRKTQSLFESLKSKASK
ncbi:MAG: DUF4129 domain-containing protein [Cyclobacteriaceae bacterium]|nr:DUF4129 domain-containing protein [Cyclobacteriaceae bacterium]